MFLHMSVILSGGVSGRHWADPPGQTLPPPPVTATSADGMDPTGMYSCTFSVYSLKTCCLQAVRKIFRESQISHLEIPKTLQEDLVNKEIINSSLWEEYDAET